MSAGSSTAVIVGGGQAAARAAKAIRSAGHVGRIRLFGAEQLLPYERPPLSKSLLKNPRLDVPVVFSATEFESFGIEVNCGVEILSIDRAQRMVRASEGLTISYDKLLIATGSRVRELDIPGRPASEIAYLRNLEDCHRLSAYLVGGRSVAVVGGGFIGLEVAATMSAGGCRVTVVEMADRLLPRLGCPEASAYVLAHHRAAGIDVRLGTGIRRGDAGRLLLDDGTTVAADIVVAGIGVVPETRLAEAAGLDVNDGIVVDEYGRTSDPDIFAAGDVTRHFNPLLGRHVRLESWQNANVQANAAGRTLAGSPTTSAEVPWLWSDQGTMNLQMAGAPDSVDAVVVRRADLAGGMSILQLKADRIVGGITLDNGKDMTMIRRLIGAGAVVRDRAALADPGMALRQFQPALAAA